MTARLFAVDAGGSRTRVTVRRPDQDARQFEFGSLNPCAVGAQADEELDVVLDTVAAELGGHAAYGWFASATIDVEQRGSEPDRVLAAASRAGLATDIVLSNDVVPLVWGTPTLAGEGIAVVCGTGSHFFGADRHGNVARAGGCEYLGSDEGGAVDIGQRGLRAAVCAVDGRGRMTDLVDALTASTGDDPARLARELAADPFPKQRLAALAPAVCHTAASGDPVAITVISEAVEALVTGIRAVFSRLDFPSGCAVAATGGVLTGYPDLLRLLSDRVTVDLPVRHVELVTDSAQVVFDALRNLVTSDRRHGSHLHAVQTPRWRDHAARLVPGGIR